MYENFQKINGEHPWRKVSPEGFIDYPVRFRSGGTVIYFNFELAKEVGLIPKNHPRRITPRLEKAILSTFSLQILNEYDWMNRKRLPKDGYEDRLYMATRYLQTQHQNKKGQTSGDGRSIWNGYLKYGNKTYDFSSCGTGNTILSPGAQESKDPIPTGSNEYGYASGLAEVDEVLAGAIMSEIFYKEQYPTERCLAVIEYPDKTGIGVRCAPNLIRPAHIFRYLKTDQWEETKASYEYFLNRQESNGFWKLPQSGKKRYLKSLEYLTHVYAKLAAVMEEEYIFNWLAWDGDNLLASGAILDYGSIRQFAAKHSKYRYEDVDRYSTCLTEQKYWAKKIIQTFAQVVDFIIQKEKRPLEDFDEDPILKLFDERFALERRSRMLWRVGFSPAQIEILKSQYPEKVENFRKVLNYFEDVKTVDGQKEVEDGIDHPPVFLVRNILRELPKYIYAHYSRGKQWPIMPAEQFCDIMAASYVNHDDLKLTQYRSKKSQEFQDRYRELIEAISRKKKNTLQTVLKRSKVINYEYRKTGDGLTWVVNETLAAKNQMDHQRLMSVIQRFIESQVLIPGKWKPLKPYELRGRSKKADLLRKMQDVLEYFKEQI